ncbi:uncharacterized protein PODANS_7_3650 [Podospora anserina S mat+]|uniref:5',5'''-P-1,P-4-tetraphosphate phosphorylase n=1 Tax=Podospora anserina (strain S / ATCC MYA-4624 / DSM 980 / FGSC 10383) TaxID=515849 RepID=B2AV99_PODAN|nr:uncharacterized protein PODANS_7_3650 [Podospora anserina S mat+]CAP68322.1 unnamed protein product [Podospora anserina S mat+]CDP31793.1 Putative 5',5'''-P-1,P-4-tetraphosphate phosphorylase [Podospora anserina S mat+]
MATTPSNKMRPKPHLPPNLPSLVATAFSRSVATKTVNFYPTSVTLLTINSIPFQLRYSPSLASKPKPPSVTTPKLFFNPFASPTQEMLITPFGTSPPSHNLVLNKFAVVPEHFILSTSAFKPQTHLLEADDLAAAYACIDAYARHNKELFVFFNSGDHSGASQPHRHLQLLPVENMKEGLEGEWDVLAKGLTDPNTRGKLPFEVFARDIEGLGGDGEELRRVYLELYNQACEAVLGVAEDIKHEGEAQISYNLAMTNNTMAVVPRLTEGGVVKDKDGQEVGNLALNGTVLAGTALVRSEMEWNALREDPDQVNQVLGRIGVPNRARM